MTLTKIAFIYLCSCLVPNSQAQCIISGNITDDQTSETIAGAQVTLTELRKTATSDPHGHFELSGIKPGDYLIEIDAAGYNKRVEHIFINKDTLINFALHLSVSEIGQVVVTGVSRSTEVNWSPISIKAVDASLLNQNSSTNLIDALKTVPGISQITTGAGISKPVIRGLGYNRVISLYNGIRQEGQQWGDEHGIEIDEYDIDRVEIVKGPGSLLYGSDGIAGVLHFLSAQAPESGKSVTKVVGNYQSNNQLLGYSVSHAGNRNGFEYLGRFSQKVAGNYQNKFDGKVYNSGYRTINGNVFLGLNKKWGYTHVHLSTYNNFINMIEGNRDSLGRFTHEWVNLAGVVEEKSASVADLSGYHTGTPHQEIYHLRGSINQLIILKNGTIHLDLGLQNNKRKEMGDVLLPKEAQLYFNLNTITYNLRFNAKAYRGWESSVGLSGMQQSNANKGIEFLIPAYNLTDIGMFVFTQKNFHKRLNLAGGLRVDHRTLRNASLFLDSSGAPMGSNDSNATEKFSQNHLNFFGISGSVGISFLANAHSTFKLNVSRGFRAPNMAEIASNGKHEGSLRYEYGNAALKSEFSQQLDAGYLYHSEHSTLEVSPFCNWVQHYIFTKKIPAAMGGDSFPDPADPTPAYVYTQGNAMLWGGEMDFDFHPHPLDWLHIENALSYVRGIQLQQADSLSNLPFMPAPKYRGELRAQFLKWGKHISQVYAKFSVDAYLRQNHFYAANGTETATPGYTLLNLGFGGNLRLGPKAQTLHIVFSADNLTNSCYQNHLNRLKYAPINPATGRMGVYNMGRNYNLRLVFSI